VPLIAGYARGPRNPPERHDDDWLAWDVAARLDELLTSMRTSDVEVATHHYDKPDDRTAAPKGGDQHPEVARFGRERRGASSLEKSPRLGLVSSRTATTFDPRSTEACLLLTTRVDYSHSRGGFGSLVSLRLATFLREESMVEAGRVSETTDQNFAGSSTALLQAICLFPAFIAPSTTPEFEVSELLSTRVTTPKFDLISSVSPLAVMYAV
jgi:hypothetical protein